jgi:hypothetical protein
MNRPYMYYDGDSFSCRLNENETRTTGHFLASKFNWKLDHYGHDGKTVDKIIRSSQRYSWEKPGSFMFIGIGVPLRLEQYKNSDKGFANYKYKFYPQEHSVETVSIQNFDSKENLDMFDDQFLQTTTLFKLVALHDFLLYNKIDFVIHNLGWNYKVDEFPLAQGLCDEVNRRPRMLNFFECSLHDLMQLNNNKPLDYGEFGWNGHPDEAGHEMYADFLEENIKQYV